MVLTRRGRLVVRFTRTVAAALALVVAFRAAAEFGLAHPAGNAWALPLLILVLLGLVTRWFIRSADRSPFDQRAGRSQLDALDLPTTSQDLR
ncbi:hypothetical protein G7075_04450 [Phycicoccus sp. HDW14]|uniref:hypothetical protein n=1 Tax=Phycicoccus sp. HDW14 TaxID=2714941 RepID=UPI001408A265|nr:hypothetical protein [Phycicoccus sp. HDW14]QIM19905.1 hypothetical protein G7075_00140 [Phycicoccus sp. HDW14]QIM20568.1 hypothetical protein G7075_04450 [Phycicoccus sp. HDW14]